MADLTIESIEIDELDTGPVITLNKEDGTPTPASPRPSGTPKSQPSVNFGGGIELLMNEKRRGGDNSRGGTDINLEDLQVLEEELNDLTEAPKPPSKSGLFNKALHIDSSGRLAGNTDSPEPLEEVGVATPVAIGKAAAAQAAPKEDPKSGWSVWGVSRPPHAR